MSTMDIIKSSSTPDAPGVLTYPAKHEHATQVADGLYSTFHSLVEMGVYPRDWAGSAAADAAGDVG